MMKLENALKFNTKIVACVMCCFASFSPVTNVQAGWLYDKISDSVTGVVKEEHPSIKVLLNHDQDAVIVEIKGTYNLYDPRTGELVSSRYKGKRRNLYASSDGIVWGEEFPGLHQIAIVPDNYNTKISVDGIEYFGSIYVYDVGGTISIVNHTLIEDYLDSLMSPMFRNEMPAELLTALAITARTNAYYQAENGKNQYWDVDANLVGYKGTLSTTNGSPVQQAVKQTQFMILNQTGPDAASKAPFAIQWGAYNIGKSPQDQPVYSKISILEAENMAKKGSKADAILTKAFPQTSIELLKPVVPTPAETAQSL
jgi:stage II sporulation protein D